MIALLVAVGIGLPIIVLGFLFAFIYTRKLSREAKNYERGLKMVSLQIHLPPVSDDVDGGARDSRDVVDENVSKAQVLYNILASTAKKGFSSGYFGQRHIGLEIVAMHGFVYFYAATPLVLIPVVKQAILSAYPSARVEEVEEYNIFNQVGKLSGTYGGELKLREHYSKPIATYQELRRDALQALLSSMGNLEKEDSAGVQILIRPAHKDWVKSSLSRSKDTRKGKKKKTLGDSTWEFVKQVPMALFKAPEYKEGGESVELNTVDQASVEAIESKTQHSGFETCIRVIASSNTAQKSQETVANINAAFALFDSQGKNGFKFSPAKDIRAFVTAYILRFFPPEDNDQILNALELASLFHFPDQKNIPTTQLRRQASKQVDGPRDMPEEGLILGYNVFRGSKKKVVLSNEDRMRHMYVIGQTGVGKSVLLENIALQDMLNGKGFAFVDPHGETAENILSMVPKERTEDVIYFCPADLDYPMGLNLFEFHNEDQIDFLIQESINMLYKLYDPNKQGMMGARFEYMFRNAAKVVMSDPAGGTFIDIPKLFNDKNFLNEKLKHVKDRTVLDFWQKEVPQSERSSDFGEVKSWFLSKFSAFLANDAMRNIIGQTKSAFDFKQVMDEGKILIINLSKGRLGELNMQLVGMILVTKFYMAALSRANDEPSSRRDFTLYVDEFQNFATDTFASILSEVRKYRLALVVANQFTTQLQEEVRDAIYGNVGSAVSFRLSAQDAENMTKQFYDPVFDVNDLTRLPIGEVAVRMLVGGVPTHPFSMTTLPPLDHENQKLLEALKKLSYAKYGRPRKRVEEEIFSRLETEAEAAARKAGIPEYEVHNYKANQPAPASLKPSTKDSFLDDWLNRKSNTQSVGSSPPPSPSVQQPSQTPPPPNPAISSAPSSTTEPPASTSNDNSYSGRPPVIDSPPSTAQRYSPPASRRQIPEPGTVVHPRHPVDQDQLLDEGQDIKL